MAEGLTIIALIAVYFLPWIVCKMRGHPNLNAILLLNLLLGWTLIGWVGALIWSVMAFNKPDVK